MKKYTKAHIKEVLKNLNEEQQKAFYYLVYYLACKRDPQTSSIAVLNLLWPEGGDNE